MFRSRLSLLTMAAALLSSQAMAALPEPVARQPEPKRPREPRPFDAPKWARKRRAKAEKERRRKLKKAGISGAGLWRRCGGRVRGW